MNPYKVLQVDREAEPEVIDAAYRRLAVKYHPDKDPSASATARMAEINAAYEILKDPRRRAAYDHEHERARAKRNQHGAEPSETPTARTPHAGDAAGSEKLAAEISNRVFKKVLWAAAAIALLVYFPWGVALLLALWGGAWIVKRHPAVATKVLKLGLGFAVAIGVYVWMRERNLNEQREKNEREVAELDIHELLRKELRDFSAACKRKASVDTPDLAYPYCSCLAASVQRQFDTSPIQAYSVESYKRQFSSRLSAASPNPRTQAACAEEARPKAPSLPAAAAKPTRPSKAAKPASPSAIPTDGIDPAVREALSPGRVWAVPSTTGDLRRGPIDE